MSRGAFGRGLRLSLLLTATLSSAIPVAAQPNGNGDGSPIADSKAENFVLDLSVPESPAFVALGLTPDKVERPTSPRELGASLLNGVDDQGNLQTGVAIETTPYLSLLRGGELTLAQYRDSYADRLFSRFLVSFATAKGTSSDDESVRLAVGFRLTPWDTGDARLDKELDGCIGPAHLEILENERAFKPPDRRLISAVLEADINQWPTPMVMYIKKEGVPSLLAKIQTFLANQTTNDTLSKEALAALSGYEAFAREQEARVKGCFDSSKQRNWNAAAWDIGMAPTWVSESKSFSDLGSAGGAVWSSLALNLPGNDMWGFAGKRTGADSAPPPSEAYTFLREHFQLIGHVRYRWDQRVATNETSASGADMFVVQDDLLIGGRLRAGLDWIAASAEGSYIREDPQGGPSTGAQRWAISGEIKITKDFWLQVSAGSEDGGTGGDDGFVIGSIRYGLSTESPYDAWKDSQGN